MKSSEKRFLLGASILITFTISLLSISTVTLHFSTRQLFVELQTQAAQFQLFEQQGKDLARAEQLYQKQAFEDCLHVVQVIPIESPYAVWAQSLSEKCHAEVATVWREEAYAWAAQDQLLEAVQVANQIKAGKYYEEMQRQIRAWTPQILNFAQEQYRTADRDAHIENAIAIVMKIPSDNPFYQEAIALRNEWHRSIRIHEQNWHVAQDALAAGDIPLVHRLTQEVFETPVPAYQRTLWSKLVAEAEILRHAYNEQQNMAQIHLQQGNREKTLEHTQKLPDRAPWGEAKAKLVAEVRELQQVEQNSQQAAKQMMQLVMATLGGSGFGFLGGLARR